MNEVSRNRRVAIIGAGLAGAVHRLNSEVVSIDRDPVFVKARYEQDIPHHVRKVPFKHRIEEHIRRKAAQSAIENARREIERNERAMQKMRAECSDVLPKA